MFSKFVVLVVLVSMDIWMVTGQFKVKMHESKQIPESHVTSKEELEDACHCRVKCYVDELCLAVTVEEDTPLSTCHYTEQGGTQSILEDAAANFVTYVKKQCQGRYTLVDGQCYIVPTAVKTYDDAKIRCEELGGVIAHPFTDKLKTHLEDIYSDIEDFWVGLEKQGGNFKWVDGSSAAGDVEMDGTGDTEKCARISKSLEYKAGDDDCAIKHRFICQYEHQA